MTSENMSQSECAYCLYSIPFFFVGAACVVLPASLKGRRLSDELSTRCVVGHKYTLQNWNGSETFSSQIVSRDDRGFLYAKWIAGPFATDSDVWQMMHS